MTISWLFIATMPHAGSTALAQLIGTSPRAVTLQARAEGQWLVPELAAADGRWDPERPQDYDRIRATWLTRAKQEAERLGPEPCVVVEKSPPNLCRMRRLLAVFADQPTKVLRLVRTPLAVCASWASRYPPEALFAAWLPELQGRDLDEAEYLRALGGFYGRCASMMQDLADLADLTVTYEELTAHPSAAMAMILDLYPELGKIDFGADLRVKDYPPQPLRNFNDEQIALLTPYQADAIARGLIPYNDALTCFGYDAMPSNSTLKG